MANTESESGETYLKLTKVMQNHSRATYNILRPDETNNSTKALMTIA
jgi:hypothetical protein